MVSTGLRRGVDKMGRVVIPQEIRSQLNIESGVDSLEIYMDGDKIVLQKYRPTCVFCDSFINIINYSGYNVCEDCINKLEELKKDL